jgi:5'-nucleotidase/UDP-sugar diphosphatase
MKRLILILAAALAPAARAAGAPKPLTVKIFHTNDVHGWIMARPDKSGVRVGGAATLKAVIDKEAGPKLILDAGDWWQGTPEGSLTKGDAVAEVFNAVGYDAVELGNHEFDAGPEAVKDLAGKLNMPVLAANLYGAGGEHVPWVRQRIVVEVGGVKFGVFGLLTSHMDKLEVPEKLKGLTVRREVDEARDQVKALRKEGADVIVAVTHVGYEQPDKPKFEGDQTLAREVAGIDVIVGGHTHTALKTAWRDPLHGTLVVQAGSYLTMVGETTLTLNPKTRRVLSATDQLLELRPDRDGENATVKAIVEKREREVGEAFKLVVATATADLSRGVANRESGLGSWMADCFKDWAGVDAAIMNGGGIRADLPSGPVTLRRLFEVMPFDDTVVKLKMSGALLRAALDHVIGAPRIAQIGGMTAEYRPLARRRERLGAVTVGGAPLDEAKVYSVVTLDFLTGSYPEFGEAASLADTGVLAREVLRLCAQKQGTIAPPPAGRMKALGD